MPRLDRALSDQAQAALAIVKAGEFAHVSGTTRVRKEWSMGRLEALYELAYLRAFAAWEICLEAAFYRSLCGYASAVGQETLVRGSYYPNLAGAEAAVLGKYSYRLWHNPQKVIERCKGYIKSGMPSCPAVQETVLASNLSNLADFSFIRHRIVHDQSDAKQKFDGATLRLAGRTYLASRPGRFLRDWSNSASPQMRWLDAIVSELVALTKQLV